MRLEFAGRSAGFGVGPRAPATTPAFAGKNRLFLAHGRQKSLGAPGKAWLVSGVCHVGLLARARLHLASDSCYPSKRPPVTAPGRKQPRETPKTGERAEAARVQQHRPG